MTATLLIPPPSLSANVSAVTTCASQVVDPAAARKRRREILTSLRKVQSSPDSSVSGCTTDISENFPSKKRRSDIDSFPMESFLMPSKTERKDEKQERKGQLKYEPELPMTKDEASAWRREQRRKRNRESAAASRQRQQGRVTELEEELGLLQDKYEAILQKIRESTEEKTGSNKITQVSVLSPESCDVSKEKIALPRLSATVEDADDMSHSKTPTLDLQESKIPMPRLSPTSSAHFDPAEEFFTAVSPTQSFNPDEIEPSASNYSSAFSAYKDSACGYMSSSLGSRRFDIRRSGFGEDHLELALPTNLISRPAVSLIVCY